MPTRCPLSVLARARESCCCCRARNRNVRRKSAAFPGVTSYRQLRSYRPNRLEIIDLLPGVPQLPKTIQKVAQKNDAFPPFFIRQNPNSVSRALFNTISTQPPTRPRQGSRFGGVCHVESSIVGVPSRRSTFPVYSWYCTRYFSVLIYYN